MLNKFHSEHDMQLDSQIANQMLSNIFDACDIEQNTVPLEVLTSYSNYRKERFLFQKFVIILLMILFFLLPILFVSPKFQLELKEDIEQGNPYVELSISTLIPIDKITASAEGKKVPVYESSNGNYQIIPNQNGIVDVTVYLVNDQSSTQSVEVSGVDTAPPQLVSSRQENDLLVLFFEEASGKLDFENIYASTRNGTIIYPTAYDQTALSVTFPYPEEALNVFISDIYGNTLQIAVTLR